MAVSDLRALEGRLGYCFSDIELLAQALTHQSKEKAQESCNERMEFLGDAVLAVAVRYALYKRYPSAGPGALTSWADAVINNQNLAEVAGSLGLRQCLKVGKGVPVPSKLLADGLEAVIGAAYLDGGIRAAGSIVERHVMTSATLGQFPVSERIHPKTQLQEWLQARGQPLPVYRPVGGRDPGKASTYEVEARVLGHSIRAEADRRKAAEAIAAEHLLAVLVAAEAAGTKGPEGSERPSAGRRP